MATSRTVEKDVHRTDRTIPLFAGEDIPHPDPDSPFADTGTNVHLEQMKDMLLTYNEYNPDLGYVQGMSDLLAPIYAVMQDDAVAFWAFVGFMDRMVQSSSLATSVFTNPTNLSTGTELPTRPVRHARAAPHPGPPRATHGPSALSAPSIRRQHELLLLLPHASSLVQARIRMGRRPPSLGNTMDRLLFEQFPPVYCARHS